jgi:hypothetical protein
MLAEDEAAIQDQYRTMGWRLYMTNAHVKPLSFSQARMAATPANEGLAGLYPGNPKQTNNRPITERLLAAFKEITLSVVFLPDQTIVYITPLSPLQIRILELLDFPASKYQSGG